MGQPPLPDHNNQSDESNKTKSHKENQNYVVLAFSSSNDFLNVFSVLCFSYKQFKVSHPSSTACKLSSSLPPQVKLSFSLSPQLRLFGGTYFSALFFCFLFFSVQSGSPLLYCSSLPACKTWNTTKIPLHSVVE